MVRRLGEFSSNFSFLLPEEFDEVGRVGNLPVRRVDAKTIIGPGFQKIDVGEIRRTSRTGLTRISAYPNELVFVVQARGNLWVGLSMAMGLTKQQKDTVKQSIAGVVAGEVQALNLHRALFAEHGFVVVEPDEPKDLLMAVVTRRVGRLSPAIYVSYEHLPLNMRTGQPKAKRRK